jgi:lipid II:glycine glycyltransferase (peptidoglycan interpeptide bridge formation enzyme)
MPAVSFEEWRSYVSAHPELHLLQTAEWGELKTGFGWEAVRLINGASGVQILLRQLPLGLTLGYIPKAKIGEELFNEIDETCRRHHAVFCKWEPDDWQSKEAGHRDKSFMPKWGDLELRSSPQNIQPARTIVVDLRGAEEDNLAAMKQKTRYNIRLAEKKGVSVRAWDDLRAFHEMMQITGGRDQFGVHSLDYYRRAYKLFHPTGMAELLVAEYGGKPLAALMVFAHGPRAWYVYGASNDEDRNRMPAYLLQWEAMRWAKARGCEEYDLWGVPDEDETTLEANFEKRHDGLWGVYRFKRGFGGELRRDAQAVDRIYSPLLYQVYVHFQGAR